MMRLSEAIRLGAMMRPNQAFYNLYDVDDEATCALGAAAEALGILDTEAIGGGYTAKAPVEWKAFVLQTVQCPECHYSIDKVDACIVHLNNEHRWSRERIADWVEALEKPPAADAESIPDAVKLTKGGLVIEEGQK